MLGFPASPAQSFPQASTALSSLQGEPLSPSPTPWREQINHSEAQSPSWPVPWLLRDPTAWLRAQSRVFVSSSESWHQDTYSQHAACVRQTGPSGRHPSSSLGPEETGARWGMSGPATLAPGVGSARCSGRQRLRGSHQGLQLSVGQAPGDGRRCNPATPSFAREAPESESSYSRPTWASWDPGGSTSVLAPGTILRGSPTAEAAQAQTPARPPAPSTGLPRAGPAALHGRPGASHHWQVGAEAP